MTAYRYLSSDAWGLDWARPPVAERTPDGETYVHHTAGGQMSPDAATAFRLLNRYAIDVKGYSALDYDILVHYDHATDVCTIGEGRGPWMSAATKDRNEQGEAIVVFGYFHPGHKLSRHPYPAELEGLARGIVWGIENNWIAPDTVILGHRDNPAHPGATGCPGDYLYPKLDHIRRRVAELLVTTPEVDMILIPPGTRPRYDSRQHGGPLAAQAIHVIADVTPPGCAGAVVNLTIVRPAGKGFATVWAEGDRPEESSHVNYETGQTIANAVTVPVTTNGSIRLWLHQPAHVVIETQATLQGATP